MIDIETSMLKLMCKSVVRPFPFPVPHQPNKPAESILFKTESFAHLTCCRTSAVGDYIGSHCRTKLTISLIDMLNSLLTLVARRKVQVYIRPLSTTLTQEAFEE